MGRALPIFCGFWFKMRHLGLFEQESAGVDPFCLHIFNETGMDAAYEVP